MRTNGPANSFEVILLDQFSVMPWEGRRLRRRMAEVSSFHREPVFEAEKIRLQANAQAYCYEMKVVQAISWALFCLFVIAFYILMQLITLAQQFGRYRIWSEPIRGENRLFVNPPPNLLQHSQNSPGSEKCQDTIIPIPMPAEDPWRITLLLLREAMATHIKAECQCPTLDTPL